MISIRFLLFALLFAWPLLGDHFINRGKAVTLYPVKQMRGLSDTTRGIRYYQDRSGIRYGVTDKIIVSFSDPRVRAGLEKRYRLHFLQRLSTRMRLYRIDDATRTLDTANRIAAETGVRFAHPDFLLHKQRRVADDYYKNQWHLKNRDHEGADIDVEAAWRYTKGEGVVTAILDEGIDIDHKDLKANVIGFANYNDPNSNYPGSERNNWHGTACAGLLCAAENGTGIVGVAPAAKLYAVRYSDSDVAQDIKAFYDLMEANVSVISNSWGSYANLDAYNEIFRELATRGRGGKGILIFFAAGNDEKNLDDPGIDDESESPWVISIGASTEDDEIAPYSNHGSSIDFLAPGGNFGGELITTDATGAKGYTDWDYNWNFVGTSAAAPIAAGVGALILSENPALTRDEVLDIMKATARKIGDIPYDADGRNDYAGYGRLDAGKAVALAHSYRLRSLAAQIRNDSFAFTIFQSVLKFSGR